VDAKLCAAKAQPQLPGPLDEATILLERVTCAGVDAETEIPDILPPIIIGFSGFCVGRF